MDRDITTKLNYWNLLANKNLFRLFFRKTEICQSWKIKASYILSSSAKSCWGHDTYILLFCIDISTKLYQGLWFNWTHLLLFQNMSIEIHTNFYNRRLELQNYLTDKMRHRMWVHILLKDLASSPFQHEYYFWCRRSKWYEKAVKFYPEIVEFKVFLQSNNWNSRFDLAPYVWCHYSASFSSIAN